MLLTLILLPIIASLVLGIAPLKDRKLVSLVGGLVSAVAFTISMWILEGYKGDSGELQMIFREHWITSLGVEFHIGIDGLSVWMLALTTLLSTIAIGFGALYITENTKRFVASVLLLEGAIVGSFLALDLILFFTFFELTLIPMWVMMTTWGGPNRMKAAVKFVAFTFGGSVFMLIGIFALAFMNHQVTGQWSFDLINIQSAVAHGTLWGQFPAAQNLIFWFFAVAFLVKAPCFPLHGWISDTYAESPVVGPVLSSAMVKLGSYGLLRFCLPLFPEAIRANAVILSVLAVVSILYGAIVATTQKDIRRLLAYSTVSHMGFVLLGIFSLTHIGMVGGALQQISHGVGASLLFILVGYLIQRKGTAELSAFGGLKASVPILSTVFLIGMLGSVGLPGLNGFVGEFLALLGSFQAGYTHVAELDVTIGAAAAFGVVVAAGYLLYMFQQVFYGKVRPENEGLADIRRPELALVTVLVILIFVGGLQPTIFTKQTEASLSTVRSMALSTPNHRPLYGIVNVDTAQQARPAGAMRVDAQ